MSNPFLQLYENQLDIAQKIDTRFRPEDDHSKRFVGVVLNTGGGKSYIFLDQFDKFLNEYDKEPGNEPNDDIVSNVPITYYTPTSGIVSQTQINVIRTILMGNYYNRYYNGNLQETVMKIGDRIARKSIKGSIQKGKGKKTYDEYMQIIEELYKEKVNTSTNPVEVIESIFDDFLPIIENNFTLLLSRELPNFKAICYKNIEDISVKDINQDTRLIVFDEAHRVGSEKWSENAEELLDKLPNTKFLSITATPERDVEGIDMMEYLAVASGSYTLEELRNKDYLASNMNLVDALEQGTAVKPIVVSFDCMLDKTKEYEDVKKLIDKKRKNKNKKNFSLNSKREPKDEYHILLLKFLDLCSLVPGKLELLKDNLDPDSIEYKNLMIYLNGNMAELSTNEIIEFYRNMYKLYDIINQMDDPETKLGSKYEKFTEKEIQRIVAKTQEEREYLKHGKHVCFTPHTTKNTESKAIMESFKNKVQTYFGFSNNDVLITHGNNSVISRKQDTSNLNRFMLAPLRAAKAIAMLAMDKFNEGLHTNGVVALEMFRQILPNKKSEKEEPKIIFLQQIGRCISSILKGKEVKEPPVIFDFACNFMRFNEKLNNIFEISENQTKFKRLIDECNEITKKKKKNMAEIPSKRTLGRTLGVMKALSVYGIDINKITAKTEWGDLTRNLPLKIREDLLDIVYQNSGMRTLPNYPIGKNLEATRNAFWHKKVKNKKTEKQLYDSSTDEFFHDRSFEELYTIGFFNDLKKKKSDNRDKVDEYGFIVGDCAIIDKIYGYNIHTGTKYTKDAYEINKKGYDVNGFSPGGIHRITDMRYNDKFFRYDRKEDRWINLHTGKDEDLLGYNHAGIRVNPEYGQVGFDRFGLWHEQLDNGSYSVRGQEYDNEGYNVYGFNSKRKAKDGTDFVNGFYMKVDSEGLPLYIHKITQRCTDPDGYGIDGFNSCEFNKQGINSQTGSYYNELGIHIDERSTKQIQPIDIIGVLKQQSNPEQRERKLIEFLILLSKNKRSIQQTDWYKTVASKFKNLEYTVNRECKESFNTERIKFIESKFKAEIIDEKNKKEKARIRRLLNMRNINTVDTLKLKNIFRNNWVADREDEEDVRE